MSPFITGCVCEVSGLLCVSLWKGSSLPSRLSAQSALVLQRRGEALPGVSALWGIAPTLFVCLFTCLLWSAGLSVCRCCHLTAVVVLRGLGTSVLLQGFKTDTGLGLLAGCFTHASLLLSTS